MEETFASLKILVVDDEEGMRLGMERALRKCSVRVPQYEGDLELIIHSAVDGEEGLKEIETFLPHIVLLDNKLPGIQGIDMLRAISDMDTDAVVIMVTAYASIETAVKAMKFGAYDFLPKPFTPDELKYVVRKAARHVALTIQAKKLAEERRQVRFQFISVLAHELKSPLNAIESYLTIVGEHSAGDDPAVYEHMVTRSLTRLGYMKKLIVDLLDMTAIESGRRSREIESLDLCEIAESVLDSYRETAAERGIALQFQGEKEMLFHCDGNEILIILNNLISNAIKYNRDEGSVTLLISLEDETLKIEVRDTGIGLTEEETEKLFRDFVRIKKEETKKILGSGLGLSIVKKIVQLYDGTVSVSSEIDRGSTFTIMLRENNNTGGCDDE